MKNKEHFIHDFVAEVDKSTPSRNLDRLIEYLEDKKTDRRENEELITGLLGYLHDYKTYMVNKIINFWLCNLRNVDEFSTFEPFTKKCSLILDVIGFKNIRQVSELDDDTLLFIKNNQLDFNVYDRIVELENNLYAANLLLSDHLIQKFFQTRNEEFLKEKKVETYKQLEKILNSK